VIRRLIKKMKEEKAMENEKAVAANVAAYSRQKRIFRWRNLAHSVGISLARFVICKKAE
jgi:hypothetical protein